MKFVRLRLIPTAAAALVAVGVVVTSVLACAATLQDPLLIAPMIQGIDLCRPPSNRSHPTSEAGLAAICRAEGLSPAPLIEAALAELRPRASAGGRLEPGYTMPVPPHKLFGDAGAGWQIDQAAVERLAATVRQTDRPLVLRPFSTHFAVDASLRESGGLHLGTSLLGEATYGDSLFDWPVTTRHRRYDSDVLYIADRAVLNE